LIDGLKDSQNIHLGWLCELWVWHSSPFRSMWNRDHHRGGSLCSLVGGNMNNETLIYLW